MLQLLSVNKIGGRSHLVPYVKDPRSYKAWQTGTNINAGQALNIENWFLKSFVFSVQEGGWF